jgi:hypothetical protein
MKKTVKLAPADPYQDRWKDLWLTKEYEPDEWERIKWDKLLEMEKYKEEHKEEYKKFDYEPYYELAGDEYQLFEQWRDIELAAETNPALQDLLDQVKMVYKLTKTK